MGLETVLIGRVVNIDLCWNIEYDCLFLTDAFPSMIDPIGYLNQQWVVDPDEELIDLPLGRRTLPRIIKDQFDHPLDGADVIGLDLVIVPGLHHLRIGGADICLTELQKQFIICPEDLHHPSPLIRDHPQQFGFDAVDHLVPPHQHAKRLACLPQAGPMRIASL